MMERNAHGRTEILLFALGAAAGVALLIGTLGIAQSSRSEFQADRGPIILLLAPIAGLVVGAVLSSVQYGLRAVRPSWGPVGVAIGSAAAVLLLALLLSAGISMLSGIQGGGVLLWSLIVLVPVTLAALLGGLLVSAHARLISRRAAVATSSLILTGCALGGLVWLLLR